MSEEIARLLREVNGKLDMVIANQDKSDAKIDGMDNRLCKVENRSTVLGAGAGALVSVGVDFIICKSWRSVEKWLTRTLARQPPVRRV